MSLNFHRAARVRPFADPSVNKGLFRPRAATASVALAALAFSVPSWALLPQLLPQTVDVAASASAATPSSPSSPADAAFAQLARGPGFAGGQPPGRRAQPAPSLDSRPPSAQASPQAPTPSPPASVNAAVDSSSLTPEGRALLREIVAPMASNNPLAGNFPPGYLDDSHVAAQAAIPGKLSVMERAQSESKARARAQWALTHGYLSPQAAGIVMAVVDANRQAEVKRPITIAAKNPDATPAEPGAANPINVSAQMTALDAALAKLRDKQAPEPPPPLPQPLLTVPAQSSLPEPDASKLGPMGQIVLTRVLAPILPGTPLAAAFPSGLLDDPALVPHSFDSAGATPSDAHWSLSPMQTAQMAARSCARGQIAFAKGWLSEDTAKSLLPQLGLAPASPVAAGPNSPTPSDQQTQKTPVSTPNRPAPTVAAASAPSAPAPAIAAAQQPVAAHPAPPRPLEVAANPSWMARASSAVSSDQLARQTDAPPPLYWPGKAAAAFPQALYDDLIATDSPDDKRQRIAHALARQRWMSQQGQTSAGNPFNNAANQPK